MMNIDLGLLFLRIATGGLMFFHGLAKLLHGHEGIKNALIKHNLPEFLWIGVPISEFIAPILIILGVLTRISSLLIAFVMLFAIYLVIGVDNAFSFGPNGGLNSELNLYFILGGLALFFTGPGKYVVSKTRNNWLK